MKKIIASIMLMVGLTACGADLVSNQQKADQVFGNVKMALVVATGAVGVYNILPECSDKLSPPFCYNESIANALNLGITAASDAVQSAEKIFAAANTDEETRLKAARVAMEVIQQVTANLAKYGLTQLRG